MRKLFDKLTGRDKLKAEIIKLERVSKRLLSRNGGLIQENRELKIRLEYAEQPVEKVEEVQEVLALGYSKEIKKVKVLLAQCSNLLVDGEVYPVEYEGGVPNILDRVGDKVFFDIDSGTYGWFKPENVGSWSDRAYIFEPVEYA